MNLRIDGLIIDLLKSRSRRSRYERSGDALKDAKRIREANLADCAVVDYGKYREVVDSRPGRPKPMFDRSYDRQVEGKAGAAFAQMLTHVPRMFWIYHKIDPYNYERVSEFQYPALAKARIYKSLIPRFASLQAETVNLRLRDPVFQPQADAVKSAKGMLKLLTMFYLRGGTYRDYNDLDKKGKPKEKTVSVEQQFKKLELIAAAGSPKFLSTIRGLAGKTNIATLMMVSAMRPHLAEAALWIAGTAYLQVVPLRKNGVCTRDGLPVYKDSVVANRWIVRAMKWLRIAGRLAYPRQAGLFEKHYAKYVSHYRGTVKGMGLARLKARLYGIYEFQKKVRRPDGRGRMRSKWYMHAFRNPLLSRGVHTSGTPLGLDDMVCRPSRNDSRRKKQLHGSMYLFLTPTAGKGVGRVTKAFYAAAESLALGGCEF